MATIVSVSTADSSIEVTLPGAAPANTSILAQNFLLRHGLEGPQIIASWGNGTTTPIEYVLVRKRGSFPLNSTDGIEVYRVAPTGDLFFSDRDLEPDHYYYYTLFSRTSDDKFLFGNNTIGKALAYDTGFFWDYMRARLPDTYFIEDHKHTKGRILTQVQETTPGKYLGEVFNFKEDQSKVWFFLERMLKDFSLEFDRVRAFIRNIPNIVNVDETCNEFLPFLSAIIGLQFNLDIPIDKQRSEIKTWVGTLKKKGTIQSISSFIQSLTKLPVDIQEYYKNILVTNSNPNHGFSSSDKFPSIDLTSQAGTNFLITVNGGNQVSVTLTIAGLNSPEAIVSELQTKINAALLADSQTSSVVVSYVGDRPSDVYVISSSIGGENTSVKVATGTNDVSSVLKLGEDNNGTELRGGGSAVADLNPQNVRNSVGLFQDNIDYTVDTRIGAVGTDLQSGFSKSAFNPSIDISALINNFQFQIAIDNQSDLDVDLDVILGTTGENIASELELQINRRLTGGGFSKSKKDPSTDISAVAENQLKISVDGGAIVEVTLDNTGKNTGELIAAELQTKINAALLADSQTSTVTVSHIGTSPLNSYLILSDLTKSTSSSVSITAGTSDITPTLQLGILNQGSEKTGSGQTGSVKVFYQGVPPFDYYIIISELKGVASKVEMKLGTNDVSRSLKLGLSFNGREQDGTDQVNDYLFNFNRFSIFINLTAEFIQSNLQASIAKKITRVLPDVIPATTEALIWIIDLPRSEIDFTRPNIDIVDSQFDGSDFIEQTRCESFTPVNKWMITNDTDHLTNTYVDVFNVDCLVNAGFTAFLIVDIQDEFTDTFVTDNEETLIDPIESVEIFIDQLELETIPTIVESLILTEATTDNNEIFFGLINIENQILTNEAEHLTNNIEKKTSKNVFDMEFIDEIITI